MNTIAEVRSHVARAIDPRLLDLIILPTEQCNFRCKYCYEDFQIGRMKEDTIASLKALIHERTKDLKQLRLSWFGGEPLVAKDIVFEISEYAKQCCDANGVMLVGNVTTNGYHLDPDTVRKFSLYNAADFQITIDGDREFHNQTRVLASGAGTYDRIISNLLKIKETDIPFHVQIRLHVTKENYEHIEDGYQKLRDIFGGDLRFRFRAKAIENLGGPATVAEHVPEKGSARGVVNRINGVKPQMPGDSHALPYVCYAGRPNSFVIRADGTVSKCTVAFSSKSNAVGKLQEDGSLSLNIDKLRKWLAGLETLDEATLGCPISSFYKASPKAPVSAPAA